MLSGKVIRARAGMAVACKVCYTAGVNRNRIVCAIGQIRRRVNRDRIAADRDLAAVGNIDCTIVTVAIADDDRASTSLHRLAESQHDVAADGNIDGGTGGIESRYCQYNVHGKS